VFWDVANSEHLAGGGGCTMDKFEMVMIELFAIYNDSIPNTVPLNQPHWSLYAMSSLSLLHFNDGIYL
jgi:hypothetical protein